MNKIIKKSIFISMWLAWAVGVTQAAGATTTGDEDLVRAFIDPTERAAAIQLRRYDEAHGRRVRWIMTEFPEAVHFIKKQTDELIANPSNQKLAESLLNLITAGLADEYRVIEAGKKPQHDQHLYSLEPGMSLTHQSIVCAAGQALSRASFEGGSTLEALWKSEKANLLNTRRRVPGYATHIDELEKCFDGRRNP
jgi:hypothetical protein